MHHCKLDQSSVHHHHHHNNNNTTITAAPWPTDSNHCHNNKVCTSIPRCVSLFFPDCGIVMMVIPHCALTIFLFSLRSVHPHHCCALLWLLTTVQDMPLCGSAQVKSSGRLSTTVELAFHTAHSPFFIFHLIQSIPIIATISPFP